MQDVALSELYPLQWGQTNFGVVILGVLSGFRIVSSSCSCLFLVLFSDSFRLDPVMDIFSVVAVKVLAERHVVVGNDFAPKVFSFFFQTIFLIVDLYQ